MNNVLIIAAGEKYVNILLRDYPLLEGRANITIYTDAVQKVKEILPFADIRNYEYSTFRYFDKFTLTYLLTQEKQTPVLYLDVGRLNVDFYRTLLDFDAKKINHIYTNSNWEGIESAKELYNLNSPYLEYGYFNNILDLIESDKINLNKIVPLLERIFIFPFDIKVSSVLNELEKVRTIFEFNSTNKQNVYTGVGNGEGLALGYALAKTNTKSFFLRDIPIKPLSVI